MKLRRALARPLAIAVLVTAGCRMGPPTRACMSVGAPGPLVAQAKIFRLDVYGATVQCNGSSVTAGAGPPFMSHIYGKSEPIVLDVPPGPHAIVLTTFADAQATMPLGQGCVVSDLSPGAQLCFNLTIAPLSDMGPPDLAMAQTVDMASAVGAPPVDMASGTAPSKCPIFGSLLCDGFEGTTIDATTWTPWVSTTGTTKVEIDSMRAYRGSSSFHAHLDANGAHATIYTALAFPQQDLWVRAFLYVPSSVTAVGPTLATMVQKSNPYDMVQLTLDPHLGINYSVGNVYQAGSIALPTGNWTCVEWQVHFDSVNGYSNLWVDSSASTLSPGGTEDTVPSPFYYYLRIGLESGTTTPLDLWIDEIVAQGSRIGCTS
jgi:hypothetical protein